MHWEPSNDEIEAAIGSILRAEIEHSPEMRKRRLIEAWTKALEAHQSVIDELSSLQGQACQQVEECIVSARRWRGCAIWLVVLIIWIFVVKAV